MASKRKSDALNDPLPSVAGATDSLKENTAVVDDWPASKKSRVSDASSSKKKGKDKGPTQPITWQDVKLDGEDEVNFCSLVIAKLLDMTLLLGRSCYLVRHV